jgi:HJR/Mrr/RecB family endonuclease
MNIIDIVFNDISNFLRTVLITLIILLAVVRCGQIATFIKEIRSRKEYIEDLKFGVLSKKDLHNYTPYEFEHWCAEFIEKQGFTDISVTVSHGDGGKDIVCKKGTETYYIECKRYSYLKNAEFKVDIGAIRKLIGSMEAIGIKNGLIITTGYATNEAAEYINTLPKDYQVSIIDGDELTKQYLAIKHLIYVQEKG